MARTPTRDDAWPVDRPLTDGALPPPAGEARNTDLPAASLIDDADERLFRGLPRNRACILCGRPLRAGQHLLRVHGSTIHARCANSSR